MKFSVVVLLSVFCVGCFKLTHAKLAVVRENRRADLVCSLGQVLDIRSANYNGRPFFCRNHDVTAIVQQTCQNERTCTLHATDGHFGDSCLGPSEVLKISYECLTVEVNTSERTQSFTVSMTTNDIYITTWQATKKTDSTTEFFTANNQTDLPYGGNQTNAQAGNSRLTNTSSDETITIATLIIGCIFGLLIIGILTIAMFRRYRERRKGSDDRLVLRMSSLSTDIINQGTSHNVNIVSNGQIFPSDKSVQSMPTKYFGNNAYNLQQSRSDIISESTTSKLIDESRQVRHDGEYDVIQQYQADILPPSYDSVSRNNKSSAKGQSMNVYSHAHYSADDGNAKSKLTEVSQKSEYLSDGHSHAAALVTESTVGSCKGENVYENEKMTCNHNGSLSDTKHLKDDVLQKSKLGHSSENDNGHNKLVSKTENKIQNNSRKSNEYDNIDVKSKNFPYQNVADDLDKTRKSREYMPMEFGKIKTEDRMENVYVPIMSPTTQSDILDDTYQL